MDIRCEITVGHLVRSRVAFLCFLVFHILCLRADGSDNTLSELKSLEKADRDALVKALIEARWHMFSNVEVKSETRVYNTKASESPDGEILGDGSRNEYHFFYVNGSWKLHSNWYLKLHDTSPEASSWSNWNRDDGKALFYNDDDEPTKSYGTIEAEEANLITGCRVACFLHDGTHEVPWEFLLKSTLDHFENSIIEIEDGLVKITAFQEGFAAGKSEKVIQVGERTTWFDVERGMCPVKMLYDWKLTQDIWFKNRVEFSNIREWQPGVWMSANIDEFRTSSNLKKDVISHYRTEITSLEVGKLTEDDLQLTFPAGVTVTDTLNGRVFIVGEDGTEQPLYSAASLQADRAGKKSYWILIWLNIGFAVLLVLGMAFRIRSQRKSQPEDINSSD